MDPITCFDYYGEPMTAYPYRNIALIGRDDVGDWYIFDYKSRALLGHVLCDADPGQVQTQFEAGVEWDTWDEYSKTLPNFRSAVMWIVTKHEIEVLT